MLVSGYVRVKVFSNQNETVHFAKLHRTHPLRQMKKQGTHINNKKKLMYKLKVFIQLSLFWYFTLHLVIMYDVELINSSYILFFPCL